VKKTVRKHRRGKMEIEVIKTKEKKKWTKEIETQRKEE
jgi:hypothetical protein